MESYHTVLIWQDHPSSPTEKENVPRVGGGKGVQYPFSVNEKVMIKVNKSHSCFNGCLDMQWLYLKPKYVIICAILLAGKQEDAGKVRRKGGTHNFPMLKWMVQL